MVAMKKNDIVSLVQTLPESWQSQIDVVIDDGGGASLANNSKSNHKKILITDKKSPVGLLDLVLKTGITQIIQTSSPFFAEEFYFSAGMLCAPENFVKNPVSSILNPLKASDTMERKMTKMSLTFSAAQEKAHILPLIRERLSYYTQSQLLIADIASVADELITNAIYNAPFVDFENSKSGTCRRDRNVSMGEGKSGRFFVGLDSYRVVVGCYDPYGRLNLDSLFARVRNCYVNGVADSMVMGSGGAGIGSYMVYDTSASYYALVDKNKTTQISCSIPLRFSNKQRGGMFKNVHYSNTVGEKDESI